MSDKLVDSLYIRPARADEAGVLSALICENARETLVSYYSPLQLRTFLTYYSVEAMAGKLQRQAVFCAEHDGLVVGTIALDGDFVVGFYTRLGYLGQGIGVALMRHLEQYAASGGLTEIRLAASPVGTGFYEKQGFTAVETALFNYLGVDFEETLMVKRV